MIRYLMSVVFCLFAGCFCFFGIADENDLCSIKKKQEAIKRPLSTINHQQPSRFIYIIIFIIMVLPLLPSRFVISTVTAVLLLTAAGYPSVTVTAFSASSLSPPVSLTFTRTPSSSSRNPSNLNKFALFATLDQTRAALEDLMRKNLDGDDTCNVEDEDCEAVEDDNHQGRLLAVFNDETNAPTPLQELEQHQQHSHSPAQHLLTTAGRRHREVEMDLLSLLLKDDADNSAVNELMHLWMYEPHDSAAAKQLESMEESCSPGLFTEMQQLQAMMQKYPTWAEPKSRLATLLYFKGQTQQAYETCLETLRLKPWHFECMHLLVLLSLRMQDFGLALYWARQGLPPMRYRQRRSSSSSSSSSEKDNDNKNHASSSAADLEPVCTKRRTAWVERALKMAGDQWQQAELDTARALQKKRGRKRLSVNDNNNQQQQQQVPAALDEFGTESSSSWQ